MQDSRFGAMFSNPEFQIDVESDQFKLLHPTLSKTGTAMQSMFSEVDGDGNKFDEDEEEDEPEGKGSDVSSDEEEDDFDSARDSAKNKKKEKPRKAKFYEIKVRESSFFYMIFKFFLLIVVLFSFSNFFPCCWC